MSVLTMSASATDGTNIIPSSCYSNLFLAMVTMVLKDFDVYRALLYGI